jgi:DNA-binding transcriptional LysR family regulator
VNERQLLAFKYVLQHGTMTQAAELLHVTQSAVSQMITNLEDDLGFPVFERRQGKITSTPQGRSFLAEAESVLDSIEKARRAAVELKNLSIGNFRIAATSVFALSLLPNALARFNKNHPEITTSLQAHHSREVRELVESRIFDLGVCELHGPTQATDTDCHAVRCAFVCHRDDPLARLPVITPRDLEERIIVTLYDQHPTTVALREAFRDQDAAWHSHVECNLFAAACQIVLHGGAVTWVDPFTLAMFSDPLLCVRPFEPEISLRFAILQGPQEQQPPHVAEMISLIREEIDAVDS